MWQWLYVWLPDFSAKQLREQIVVCGYSQLPCGLCLPASATLCVHEYVFLAFTSCRCIDLELAEVGGALGVGGAPRGGWGPRGGWALGVGLYVAVADNTTIMYYVLT